MTLVDSPYVDDHLMPVFVYGTLQPGEVRWFALEGRVVDDAGEPDHVLGRLWDTGRDFPALTLDHPAVLVPGRVLRLRAESAMATWALLVEIEGGADSAYQPAVITTVSGVRALAFPYGAPPPDDFVSIRAWRHGPQDAMPA